MQKYKIVASKSQKKYTLIISADSESDARDRIHKEWYSILGSSVASEKEILWKKFIFQVEKEGKIKNGVIVGKDIFKVYMKLRDELEYNIICLYPEWDEAHSDAQKKQKIMHQLEQWYLLQQQKVSGKKNLKKKEDNFYLKKELDTVAKLVASVIKKLDTLMSKSEIYNIDQEKLWKLQQLYNKLIHIKGSTNLSKLKEIGELALIKVWEIELQSIEQDKNQKSSVLLHETNDLLKQIGSDQHFIEKDKDIKRMIREAFSDLKKTLSLPELKKVFIPRKDKNVIDTQSYGFLKTVLLLEKYQDRLHENTKEMRKNFMLFILPFKKSQQRDKIFLTRRVLKQNISILKAKKTGSLSSYTWVRKGYHKITENIFKNTQYFQKFLFGCIVIFSAFFFLVLLSQKFNIWFLGVNHQGLLFFLFFFFLFLALTCARNIFMTFTSIVFFAFLFIFFKVNF